MTDHATPGGLGRAIASSLEEVTLHKVREEGFKNAALNAGRIAAGQSVMALQSTPLAQGEAALVIGAGPSLHRTNVAAVLAESNFTGTIIATESAMAYCFRHDIVPHLIVTLDPHAQRIVRWFGDPLLTAERLAQDDYFARQDMDPAFAQNQLKMNEELLATVNRFGPRVHAAIASSASPAVAQRVEEAGMPAYWWNPFYDDYDQPGSLTRKIFEMNRLPCLNAGGNVGSASWVLAQAVLGKKHIALAGIDFGYYGDTPYEKTQYYYELIELVGKDRLDEVYVRFHNPHLDAEFYTDPAYLWYRDSFLQMAAEADCTTYNCTGGGILFGEPIRWTPLADFLKRFSS
jgi:hypothetical protein